MWVIEIDDNVIYLSYSTYNQNTGLMLTLFTMKIYKRKRNYYLVYREDVLRYRHIADIMLAVQLHAQEMGARFANIENELFKAIEALKPVKSINIRA